MDVLLSVCAHALAFSTHDTDAQRMIHLTVDMYHQRMALIYKRGTHTNLSRPPVRGDSCDTLDRERIRTCPRLIV